MVSEPLLPGGLVMGAYWRMLIIGIGYMFPICAVWAAFDYWKLLFPDQRVEYDLNMVYQLGSVSTVLILSFCNWQVNIFKRIITGFCGQFITLAVILSFRWLPLSADSLFLLLMINTVAMSVVTGILDSAILSLNSQYSPRMQEAMQVGIGFSIFVSVIFRVVTKFLGRTPEEAATAFFSISLLTVFACIYSFVSLLNLPVSAGVARISPVNPGNLNILRKCWKNELVVFLHFCFCGFGYPAMITAIPSKSQFWKNHWFQTILLTVFTITDLGFRSLVRFRGPLNPGNIGWTVLARFVIIPFLVVAASGWFEDDWTAVLIVGLFGMSNGYFISLSLILMNEIPNLSKEELFNVGRFSAFAVNAGLCLGGLTASFFASILDLQ